MSLKRYQKLEKDAKFLADLKAVTDEFNEYMALKAERTTPSVAYFCMEYGLDIKQVLLQTAQSWRWTKTEIFL